MGYEPSVNSHHWAAKTKLGDLRCVSCGEAYTELDTSEDWDDPHHGGTVFDLGHFVALCKRCVLGVVSAGARYWPKETAEALGKGLLDYGKDREGVGETHQRRKSEKLLRSAKVQGKITIKST